MSIWLLKNSMKPEPIIIIISQIKERQGISRLPAALKSSGFEVMALCHADSYLAKTKYVDKLIPWKAWSTSNALGKIMKIIQVIEKFKPQLVIPADEKTIQLLFQVLKFSALWQNYGCSRRILEKSLFKEQFLHKAIAKDAFVTFAAELGIRVPQNHVIHAKEEALDLASVLKFPVVLKQSIGSSGRQVSIHESIDTLESELTEIFKLRFLKQTKRNIVSLLQNSFSQANNHWSLQQFIQGDTAMFVFVACQGKILGHLPLYKKQTFPGRTGPSSVIQSFNCPEMLEFAEKIVQEIEFNGFGSIDFIIEKQTQKPYVIEFNPRPVPACHLGAHFNINLCQLLANYLQGRPLEQSELYSSYTIALFPSEYLRDPASPHLKTAFHDIPWGDDNLIAALAPHYIASHT